MKPIRIDTNSNSKRLEEIFSRYPYIAAAYLFGSYAQDKEGPMSDIDIALLLKKPLPEGRKLIHEIDYLAYLLSKTFGREVDVVILNHQGLVFQHNVLKTSRLIYDAAPDIRIRFETEVITRYCDFEPTLRFMDKYYPQGYRRRLAKI